MPRYRVILERIVDVRNEGEMIVDDALDSSDAILKAEEELKLGMDNSDQIEWSDELGQMIGYDERVVRVEVVSEDE